MGAYNYIREDVDPISQRIVPRKYFSGGEFFGDSAMWMKTLQVPNIEALKPQLDSAQMAGSSFGLVKVQLNPINDSAQLVNSSILKKLPLMVALAIMPFVSQPPGVIFPSSQKINSIDSVKTITPIKVAISPKHHKNKISHSLQRILPIYNQTDSLTSNGGDTSRVNPISVDSLKTPVQVSSNPVDSVQVNPVDSIENTPALHRTTITSEVLKVSRSNVIDISKDFPALDSVKILPISQPSLLFSKVLYHVSLKNVPTVPVEDFVVAGSGGYLTGLDPLKDHYKKGDTICTIQNLELDNKITDLTKRFNDKNTELDTLKSLYNQVPPSASIKELSEAQGIVDALKGELAKNNEEKAINTVIAPEDLRVKDLNFQNDVSVPSGAALLSYYSQQRARIDINLPIRVSYFYGAKLTLNGHPVTSVFPDDWLLNPSQSGRVSLTVEQLPSLINSGDNVNGALSFYYPAKSFEIPKSIKGSGETTSGVVGKVEQYRLSAPVAGTVKFFVKEGDNVKVGDVLAQVDPKFKKEQLAKVKEQIRNIDLHLQQAALPPDSTRYITISEENDLKSKKSDLLAEANTLQKQIVRTKIISPYNGIVVWSAEHKSRHFQSYERLLDIMPGTVFLGGIKNGDNDFLLDRSKVKAGDPVLVRTTIGSENYRLLCRVEASNKNPYSSIVEINRANQSVEIKVFDPQHILRPGLPVQVTRLNTEEKKMASAILANMSKSSVSSGSGAPPPPPDSLKDLLYSISLKGYSQNTFVSVKPPSPYLTFSNSLSFAQLKQQIIDNNLALRDKYISVLISRLNEGLPRAKQISLTGDILTRKNGTPVFAFGIKGVFNGLSWGFSKGNALGIGSSVLQAAGAIVDLVGNKKGKERKEAIEETANAFYSYQTELFEKVNRANNLLIDIGAAEQRMAQLEKLRNDLENAHQEILNREKSGVSLFDEEAKINAQMWKVNDEISNLEIATENFTTDLNKMKSQTTVSLQDSVSVNLSWTKGFSTIPADTLKNWQEKLTADTSKNSQMQEAITALNISRMASRLQGFNKLPQLNATTISMTNPGLQDYDPLSGTLVNKNGLTQGVNGVGQLEIPLFNQKNKINGKIAALQIQENSIKLQNIKMELAANLTETAYEIKNLSEKSIPQAERNFQNSYQAWSNKANDRDFYLTKDYVDERKAVYVAFDQVIKYKAQYMKAVARLWQLQLLDQGAALQDQAMMSDLKKMAGILAVFIIPLFAWSQNDQEGPFRHNPSLGMGLMSSSSLKPTLISDPNILRRMQALDVFLKDYQSGPQAVKTDIEIVENSHYPEVIAEISEFMVERKDHDLRSFVQIISDAEVNKNLTLVSRGYRSLENILLQDTSILKNLNVTAFYPDQDYPQMSPQIAKKVFLTFLASNPEGIAQTRFLQSDYWNTVELAQIYNELKVYIVNQPADPQFDRINKLAELIYDWILREKVLENMDEAFSLGPYENLTIGIFNNSDVTSRVWIQSMAYYNRLFLNSSKWRDMENHIKPELFQKAKGITKELISSNPAQEDISQFPLYGLYPPINSRDYLDGLDLSIQRDYIKNLNNTSELALFLKSSTMSFLWEEILDKLMATADGRLLVLKDYVEAPQGSVLLRLIESRNWLGIIRKDARDIENPAENRILREALKKMYDRTKQEWLLNVLLDTYSAFELYSFQDPRGRLLVKAQIDKIATEWALKDLRERSNYRWVMSAGESVRSPEELTLLQDIDHKLQNADDPRDVETYLSNLQTNNENTKIKSMLKDLIDIRDKFAGRIKNNDQKIPPYLVITKYFLGLLAGFLFFKIFKTIKRRKFLLTAQLSDSILDLQKQLDPESKKNGNSNSNGYHGRKEDSAMVAIHKKNVYGPVFEPLQTWRDLVYRWSQEKTYPAENLLNDFNTILNNAAEVIRLMPYSPDLIWSNDIPLNDYYLRSYSYFNMLANDTLNILLTRLKKANLSDLQRQRFLQDKNVMQKNMKYVSRYLRILHYRANIDKVMGYKFPDNHLSEMHGYGPYVVARMILLYQMLWKQSENNLRRELPDLLADGNELMPDFYGNPKDITQESERRLKEVTWAGKTISNSMLPGTGYGLKKRSFYSRMWGLLGPAQIFIGTMAILFGLSWAGVAVILSAFVPTCYTLINFWTPHVEILRMTWNNQMNNIIDRLNIELNNLLDAKGIAQNESSPYPNIVSMVEQEGKKEIAEELDPNNTQRVDAIVISVEEQKDVSNVQQYVDSLRGGLIRRDIPVEVMYSKFKGSGNAYLEALEMVKNNFERGVYKDHYLHLKPWEDARVMFVFHGKDAMGDNTLINWAITSGYRAAASMSQSLLKSGPKKENIIIYDRFRYYGPIQHVAGSDITLLTSRVKEDALKGLGWVNTEFSKNGNPRVNDLFEKMDIRKMIEKNQKESRGDKTVKYLESEGFDLSNQSLDQFSALNGMILLGPGAVNTFEKIAEDSKNNKLNEKLLRIHMTSDLMIPLLLSRGLTGVELERKIDDYVAERSRWPDMINGDGIKGARNGNLEAIKNNLEKFYNIIIDAKNPEIAVNAFVPHPRSEKYEHELKRQGGIDLNFQPQFIQQFSPTGSTNFQEAIIPNMPSGFKGFGFDIVRFTSQLTVNGAFQLMLSSN